MPANNRRTVKQNVYELHGTIKRAALELEVSVHVIYKYMRDNNISDRALFLWHERGYDILPFVHLLYGVRRIPSAVSAVLRGRPRRPRIFVESHTRVPLEEEDEDDAVY